MRIFINTQFVLQRAKSTNTMIVNGIDGKVEVSDTLFLKVLWGHSRKY